MLFFCPLDNPGRPIQTTLADQRAAMTGWERKRQGLAVDALSARAASLTLEAYLIDCHRSGRPGYAPSVEIEEREGVPVATLIFWPGLGDDATALKAMIDEAKRKAGAASKKAGPAKLADMGEMTPKKMR